MQQEGSVFGLFFQIDRLMESFCWFWAALYCSYNVTASTICKNGLTDSSNTFLVVVHIYNGGIVCVL